MSVPSYEDMMLPMLSLIRDGRETIKDCIPGLIQHFRLADADIGATLPSGGSTIANRAHWARTYMAQARLVAAQKRGRYFVTPRGQEVLDRKLSRIDSAFLLEFSEFVAFKNRRKSPLEAGLNVAIPAVHIASDLTPEDRISEAFDEIEAALSQQVLDAVISMKPEQFERLILDLLTKMGYGAGKLANSQMTKASGDGGIDGIINEDALGLDAVYIQAKRYAADSKVGRPALQAFVGSLTGEGANKGVFVTTSDFSKDAKDYLNKVQHRIVLINGDRLARLMIQHEVGVRARKTYVLRSVDEDYFAEPDAG